MNNGVSYNMFYEILLNLRDYFHSYGRIDDSNAKLDEIVKLLSISFCLAKKGKRFGISYLRSIANKDDNLAKTLIDVFNKEISSKMFINNDGTNIFGSEPSLNIQTTDSEFAEKIVSEIEKIDFLNLIEKQEYSDFDIINECFGHFVRENFRNNKEDAQYMTPYEISVPMLDIVFNDMIKDGYMTKNRVNGFKIMDATCGVGTLLIESANHFNNYIKDNIKNSSERNKIICNFRNTGMIGQDKVDRMVRLSKINTLLFGGNISNIFIGNSIVGDSKIISYRNKINLIFTNPPFGAEYKLKNIDLKYYPILKKLNLNLSSISSELLMLDRSIDLLEEGGYLAVVLPDSVFASKGIESQYRDEILDNYDIKGVVELPSVTFAQAGTRTNTCILYLKKHKKYNKIYMMICNEIGYMVKEKAGVPVKIESGKNDMRNISKVMINSKSDNKKMISEDPSITLIDREELTGNVLKPSFYAVNRFKAIDSLKKSNKNGYKVSRLYDMVEFVTTKRKSYAVSDDIKHISVLHVNPDCTINFGEVEKYNPICKGRECLPGDLIFSKINPRIPRMAVVPNVDYKTVCSSEFEILRPKQGYDIYSICYLLRTNDVMMQIESLTSGTSSSHSRIKREQLAEIKIPIPIKKDTIVNFNSIGKKLKSAVQTIYNAENIINNQMALISNIAYN